MRRLTLAYAHLDGILLEMHSAQEGSRPARVLVVDDQALVREALCGLLQGDDAVDVVGSASDGTQTMTLTERLQPDVVVMDVCLLGQSGIDVTRELCERYANIAVLMLTGSDIDANVIEALRAGARGYLHKSAGRTELFKAIKTVRSGYAFLPPEATDALIHALAKAPVQAPVEPRLTRRETEILVLVGEGLSNRDIGLRLNIALGTVRTHLTRIMSKIDVESRTQAALYALEHHGEMRDDDTNPPDATV